MSKVHFVSALSDGSEARKTKEEKELVYAKCVYNGFIVVFYLKIQRMFNFGGCDANHLLIL